MKTAIILLLLSLSSLLASAQQQQPTNTDIFIMGGTDFVRPGLAPRANLNIGAGHDESFLKNFPLGDELTVSYTYENGGNHGFFHTNFGSHTLAIGIMNNFAIVKPKKLKNISLYTWPLIGATVLTGNSFGSETKLYGGLAFGLSAHLNRKNAIWIQETLNKIVSIPWYTSTSIGWTFSFYR